MLLTPPLAAHLPCLAARVQAKLLVPADRRLREGDWRPRGYPYPGRLEGPMGMVGLVRVRVRVWVRVRVR